MKISIVMATYNGEKYIEEQMESLRNQTRPADQVIVVDDCSTDTTPDIIDNFIAKHKLYHWRYSSRMENKGYIHTFREALALTTSDIIFLCDQDDVWFPEKIQIMEEAMEVNPKIQMLSCDDIWVDECLTPKPVKLKFYKSHNNRITGRIRQKGACVQISAFPVPCVGCYCAITRSLCSEYLQMPVYTMPHDTALAQLAVLKEGYFFLNTTLIYRRRHSSNVSQQYKRSYDIGKRCLQAEALSHIWADMPTIVGQCGGELEQKKRSKYLRRSHVLIHLYELRLAFLRQGSFWALLQYGLYSLRIPQKLIGVAMDVLLVVKKRIAGGSEEILL